MKVGAIGQIALAVRDLETSVAFYRDVTGFPLLFEAPPAMAFFDVGGIRLMLSQADEVTGGGPILYFRVNGIEEIYDAIAKRGGDCIRAPLMTHAGDESELWLAFFRDPDGHTLGLMEERRTGSE